MTALSSTRLKEQGQYFTNYAAVLPADHTLEMALKPDFWAHVGIKLRMYDTIRLIPEDSTFIADLIVLACGRGFAKVKLLHKFDLGDAVNEPEEETHYLKFRGPHCKWSVLRKDDDAVLREGFDKKEDAALWLKDHLAALDH